LYKGVTFEKNSDPQITIHCNADPTDLDFNLKNPPFLGTFNLFFPAGVYRDVVKITVTTP